LIASAWFSFTYGLSLGVELSPKSCCWKYSALVCRSAHICQNHQVKMLFTIFPKFAPATWQVCWWRKYGEVLVVWVNKQTLLVFKVVGLHSHSGDGHDHENEDKTYIWKLLIIIVGIWVLFIFENSIKILVRKRVSKIHKNSVLSAVSISSDGRIQKRERIELIVYSQPLIVRASVRSLLSTSKNCLYQIWEPTRFF